MTLKSVFSGSILLLALGLSAAPAIFAQQRIIITRSQTGRVSSDTDRNSRRSSRSVESEERAIFDLINEERRKKGLGDLEWDGRLAGVARDYSRRMAREDFFSHYDRDGNSVVERARDSNVRDWRQIGENLFYCEGYDQFDELAVRGWMKSPDHRRNILDRRFNASGIGIARARDGRIYITQVFIER
ncbi:MAG: CAP domain-containing protein [Acidobacteria bacterium]|nr:CAP domain-containing protein [Acidobacteriota bacterium]